MATATLRVVMYSAQKLYGFAANQSGSCRVFFHLETFHPGVFEPGHTGPPPIVGEMVLVEYTPNSGDSGQAPRAQRVDRTERPERITGVVETFSEQNGWGFIKADSGESFYLHRCEVEDGRLPLPGRRVSFYRGFREKRPRACYINLEL